MMREHFSDQARKVMQIANQEAIRMKCNYIGTEHILLGIVEEPEGLAGKLLRSLDAEPQRLRQLAQEVSQSGTPSPRLSEVVGHAIEEARNHNHIEIDTEHLLLGLLRNGLSAAVRCLESLGLSCGQVRDGLLARMTPGSSADVTRWRAFEARFRDHPQVKNLQTQIDDLQRQLESAVAAMKFDAARLLSQQRRAVQQELEATYARLDQ